MKIAFNEIIYLVGRTQKHPGDEGYGPYNLRDVTTGATGATEVAPKFSDTFTLFQPRRADSAQHHRGRS